ncbi:hypothetical protein D9Q98_003822 [Chlorella vulgaris]|uniref:Uncharacterized protein n=1 Tax=Chlorella vulgaris TaxID=3077 RepID=A0A9D4TQU9_CHLVU|nr:hypothetical protein D9Q98_003822 [Chlorella vulgaris]
MGQRRSKRGAACESGSGPPLPGAPPFASLTQGVVTAATGAGVTMMLRRALAGTGLAPSGLGQAAGKESSVTAAAASTGATLAAPTVVAAAPPPTVPPPPPPDGKPVNDVVAGAMARAASQSTIHPLDTMKVRMQTGRGGGGGSKASSSGAVAVAPRSSSSSSSKASTLPPRQVQPLQRRLLEVKGLYKGVVGAATGAGIIIGTYFAFYSTTKRFLREKTDFSDGATAFTAGAVAALGSSVVKVPLAVCIRSVQAGIYRNVFHAASSITTAAGVRGLFTGFLPTVLEDVPDMAVKFAAYEMLRNLHTRLNGRPANVGEDLIMGGFAGAAAAAATTPLDVVKTVMMCSASSRPTIVSAARGIMREGQGLRPFFRGVGPRALSNGLNSAIFFCFFEAIRQVLIRKEQERLQPGHQKQRVQLKQVTAAQRSSLSSSQLQDPSVLPAVSSRAQGSPAACLTLALPLAAAGGQQQQ